MYVFIPTCNQASDSGGYEHRVYESGPIDGEFANAMITVPIYSRKQRLDRQEHTNGRIEHLAELYSEHQSQSAIMNALDQEKKVLKRTMLDDGAVDITAYYGLIKEVEQARSKRDGAGRKTINWLELCGYQYQKQESAESPLRTAYLQKPEAISPKPIQKMRVIVENRAPIQIEKRGKQTTVETKQKSELLVGVGD